MTKEGADGGIDLVYTNPKTYEKVAVQIKHHANAVKVNVVRETDNAAKRNYGAYLSEIIVSGRLTTAAQLEADKYKGLKTKDQYWLDHKVVPWMKMKSKTSRKVS